MTRGLKSSLMLAGGIGALAALVIFSDNVPWSSRGSKPLPVPLHRAAVPPGNGNHTSLDSKEQVPQTPLELEEALIKSYENYQITEPTADILLSNDMRISKYSVDGVIETEWGSVYIVDTGYPSPKYDRRVFDLGDGKPFVFTKVNKKGEHGEELWDSEKGEHVLDHLEKRFDLTYRFCNESHGPFGNGTYPMWEPTAFRGDPCYGTIGSIKREGEE